MATHSSILVWRIPWTEELGGLQSLGCTRIKGGWVGSQKYRSNRTKPASVDTPDGFAMQVVGDDREAWCAAAHGVAKRWTRLSD